MLLVCSNEAKQMHRRALNVWFVVPALVFVALFGFFAFYFPKGVPELWINAHTNLYSDQFFLYATELGHGLFFAGAVVALLFVRVGYAAAVAFAGLICALVTQTMKRLVYADAPRPPKFFEGLHLHFVSGSEVLYTYSFPSGHTMSAFAVMFLLAHLVNEKKWGMGFGLLAGAVGMSRVYLLKHFFLDVFVGASVGLVIALLVHHFIFPIARTLNYKLTRRGFVRLDA